MLLTTILTIVFVNIVYMTITTLRMILVIKGHPKLGSFISMFEEFVYLVGLTLVLEDLNDVFTMFAYCLSWGIGVYIGSVIEQKLALGYVSFLVISDNYEHELLDELTKLGYHLIPQSVDTSISDKKSVQILLKRKDEKKIKTLILSYIPEAFIITSEPTNLTGKNF